MKRNVRNRTARGRFGVPRLFLASAIVLVAAIMIFAVVPLGFATGVTMEVYQQEGRVAFGKEQATVLDIFNNAALGGQRLLTPKSGGSYQFAVFNNSDGNQLPYSIDIVATNPNNLPIVGSLERNGQFVFGGPGAAGMLPLTEVNIPEVLLNAQQTDQFTLHWAWRTESNAANELIGSDGTQLYTLTIVATGMTPEIDVDGGPGGSQPPSGPGITPPGGGGTGGSGLPQTGDAAPVWPWLAVLTLSGVALMWLIIWGERRESEGEKGPAHADA